ncbi:MAG: Dabb family protein [Halioglobus sp.]
MSKVLFSLMISCTFFTLVHYSSITNAATKAEGTATQVTEVRPDSVLRHVVIFKFKDDADPLLVQTAVEGIVALPSKIPQIKAFEWGINNSPEDLNKGLTHCFVLTFYSEEDRAIYLPHPDHKAFVALLDGILEDVTVVDYWTK